MLPYCRLAILLIVANILWTSTQLASAVDRLYSVQQDTILRDRILTSTNDDDFKIVLRRGTLVQVIPNQLDDSTGRVMQRIATLETIPQSGWVPANTIIRIDTWIKLLNQKAHSIQSNNKISQSIPRLIITQTNPEIRKAWREATEAFEANMKLPEDQRLPDPYFARAEIWMTVNNYVAAIEDYVVGIHYARKSDRDILTYSQYFEKLQNVAEKLLLLPVPDEGTDQSLSRRGFMHFNRGVSYYLRGNYELAIDNLSDAVSLAPAEPLCWYFRGLAYKAAGDSMRAQHDALLGAHFERKITRFRRKEIDRSLFRVQGPDRIWLETIRLGSPNGHGLVTQLVPVATQ